jgi:hypothetical protein
MTASKSDASGKDAAEDEDDDDDDDDEGENDEDEDEDGEGDAIAMSVDVCVHLLQMAATGGGNNDDDDSDDDSDADAEGATNANAVSSSSSANGVANGTADAEAARESLLLIDRIVTALLATIRTVALAASASASTSVAEAAEALGMCELTGKPMFGKCFVQTCVLFSPRYFCFPFCLLRFDNGFRIRFLVSTSPLSMPHHFMFHFLFTLSILSSTTTAAHTTAADTTAIAATATDATSCDATATATDASDTTDAATATASTAAHLQTPPPPPRPPPPGVASRTASCSARSVCWTMCAAYSRPSCCRRTRRGSHAHWCRWWRRMHAVCVLCWGWGEFVLRVDVWVDGCS